MTEVVFDASALMALLQEERGSKVVETYLSRAVISTVNLSEVIAQLIKFNMPETSAITVVSSLGLSTIAFDEIQACKAAALIKSTYKAGLSLGDRACLALAQHLGLPAITADRAWNKLDIDCEIKFIR